jgi:transcriptional regulator
MYLPAPFLETDRATLAAVIQDFPFALLIATRDGAPPEIAHLPFLLEPGEGEHGTLYFHVARPNPVGGLLDGTKPATVVFQGPHAYVSPSWYQGEVAVPTWNYVAVHAHGTPVPIIDDQAVARLLDRLVASEERHLPAPWTTAGQTTDFLGKMRRGIVAFAMPIERLEGKFKLSQNRPAADREGARAGLRGRGGTLNLATADAMAAWEERAAGRA